MTETLGLTVVTNGLFDVTGEEALHPEKATILGPCQTIPLEFQNINCRVVDVDGSQLENPFQSGLMDRLLTEIRTSRRTQ
jgi:hypothetical protein